MVLLFSAVLVVTALLLWFFAALPLPVQLAGAALVVALLWAMGRVAEGRAAGAAN